MEDYLWTILKWRGPSGIVLGKSIRLSTEVADLDREDLDLKIREIAAACKPNTAWRLIEYEIAGRGRVALS